jgi:hypothetical protein
MRSNISVLLVCLTTALAAGCGDNVTDEELQQIIEEAKACAPGDTCVLAGGGRCTCAQPVNAEHRERVEQAVADHDCGGLVVRCMDYTSVRCEAGRCVADRR